MAVIGTSGKSIKSVQRGSSTTYSSAATINTTISAVVLANTFVNTTTKTGYSGYDGSAYASMNWDYGAVLTTTTNLQLLPGNVRTNNTQTVATVYWEVIEFE